MYARTRSNTEVAGKVNRSILSEMSASVVVRHRKILPVFRAPHAFGALKRGIRQSESEPAYFFVNIINLQLAALHVIATNLR
jgi:hypothetical protein